MGLSYRVQFVRFYDESKDKQSLTNLRNSYTNKTVLHAVSSKLYVLCCIRACSALYVDFYYRVGEDVLFYTEDRRPCFRQVLGSCVQLL